MVPRLRPSQDAAAVFFHHLARDSCFRRLSYNVYPITQILKSAENLDRVGQDLVCCESAERFRPT
jgi:hypothetical protein